MLFDKGRIPFGADTLDHAFVHCLYADIEFKVFFDLLRFFMV